MIIDTRSFNQTQSIQDNNTLSRQIPTTTVKNTPFLTSFNKHNNLDEPTCLYRHTRACIGTGVSKEAQDVSSKARTVPAINFYRARTGNKVDIYKKLN